MKILAIDTSSKNATVAIVENEETLIELNNNEEKTHSQKLMPMVDEALRKTNLSLDGINLIACCLGPGSFTGVRIGIATAKAFADSKNIPTVGISSLEGLAYNLNTEGWICSLIDAGHGNAYAGLFKIERDKNGILQTIEEDLTFLNLQDEKGKLSEKKLIIFLEKYLKTNKDLMCDKDKKVIKNTNSIKNNLEKIHFVGDATTVYEEVLQDFKLNTQDLYEIELANHSQNVASGIAIARIGYTKYKNGEYGDTSILSPVYLRKSQAELALEQKTKK